MSMKEEITIYTKNGKKCNASYTKEIPYQGKILRVTYDVVGLNIHVENSHFANNKKAIRMLLDQIIGYEEAWEAMRANGYTRKYTSLVNEWCAHNYLYNRGREPERTGSVDLDQFESIVRRFVYCILSMLYNSYNRKLEKQQELNEEREADDYSSSSN